MAMSYQQGVSDSLLVISFGHMQLKKSFSINSKKNNSYDSRTTLRYSDETWAQLGAFIGQNHVPK